MAALLELLGVVVKRRIGLEMTSLKTLAEMAAENCYCEYYLERVDIHTDAARNPICTPFHVKIKQHN